MTIREAWEKKKAAQAAAGQAAARSGETVAPKGRQPGKLKKLFSKTGMAIAATTMLTAAVAATTGQGSGSGSGSGDCSGNYCYTEIKEMKGGKTVTVSGTACCDSSSATPKACCLICYVDTGLFSTAAVGVGQCLAPGSECNCTALGY